VSSASACRFGRQPRHRLPAILGFIDPALDPPRRTSMSEIDFDIVGSARPAICASVAHRALSRANPHQRSRLRGASDATTSAFRAATRPLN